MAQVINPTSFPHALYRKLGPGGLEYQVLAVRGTFRFTGNNRRLALAETQRPIRWQETYAAGPEGGQARYIVDDSDLIIGKPTTDVHVHGILRSPTGQPRSAWQVRVQVGPVDKRLIVRGPREFRWQLIGGWRVTQAEPVSEVPLDYRYAFGGHYTPEAHEVGNDTLDVAARTLYYPDNPVGRGWLPKRADYKQAPGEVAKYLRPDLNAVTRLPAPQLEDPDWPVHSPFDRLPPAGFGPIARWWQPRINRQGTLDEEWLAHRHPHWPDDFDARFYNSAHPDLMAPDYLRGDELVILTNCLAGSQRLQSGNVSLYSYRTRLPGLAIKALAEQQSGKQTVTRLALDTVGIDLDLNELTLTWRALFPPQDPLRRMVVAATGLRSPRTASAVLPATGGTRHVG
ncbi:MULTISPECIES: DUF2169 family type VI secretion system accessory protein [Halomonadaceae]|jgi:hypothetical protein|uniref:DUF2169 family type VI secretion system accessory protein n=1 Tax=Halomonadaceae TaxID=28256 RepID=UPI0012F46FA5|nr:MULTISPECIES: DUF2169 domain-containing protein [Halomonas]CAD5256731.1 conserved hypothetical protein [Halomonas sp. 59]CAD5256952.1 conserved hypothetical protein [Halomonas sp. 113]CAD5270759.1 conserved hypothetical protein [Halomonas sp. I3]CAD5291961.1 conserved hypothetical protein [Halomonas sp. 156]VXB21976.1 conserved hypothetical protein [Halomonas titanicae]